MLVRYLLGVLAALAPTSAARAGPCALEDGPHVTVSAKQRVLHLCEGPRSVAHFTVSLGTGGTGKQRQGDGKTPLGRYLLGRPRPSRSGFHTFVPVGYPTAEQRERGLTGGAIGIHGPPDYLPAAVTNLARGTDWTEGCILVFSNDDIARIARWVRQRQREAPVWVVISDR